MIYPMVPFPVTLSDPYPIYQGHGVIFMPTDAFSVLCAQLTRDLLAIAKFSLKLLFYHTDIHSNVDIYRHTHKVNAIPLPPYFMVDVGN